MKTHIQNVIASSLLLFSTTLLAATSEGNIGGVHIIKINNPPQSMNIHIGDVLYREIEVEVTAPYQLTKASFPVKGTRQNDIELVDFKVETNQEKSSSVYKVGLTYQVFSTASTPVVMALPTEKLALTGGAKALILNIPEWKFWFSPLVAANMAVAKANLHPQDKAPLVDITSHEIRLAIYLTLLTVGMIGLIYVNAQGRWMPFMGGPFALACRQLKHLSNKDEANTTNKGRDAFAYIHQAFNKTYGSNLFARDVPHFVEVHSRFYKVRPEIEAFFEKSNHSLFDQQQLDMKKLVEYLTSLSRKLRDCERGV